MPTLPPSLLSPLQTPHLAPTSGCSCYRVRNVYCCKQALCVCHSLCFNGSALLSAPTPQPTSGRNRQMTGSLPPPCLPPQYTLNQIQPSLDGASSSSSGITDVLSPIPCSRKAEFAASLNMALTEAPIRGGLHAASEDTWHKWVGRGGGNRDKGGSAEWRDGSTLLIPLDDPTTNVAHFIGGLLGGWMGEGQGGVNDVSGREGGSDTASQQCINAHGSSSHHTIPPATHPSCCLQVSACCAFPTMRQHGQQGWIPSVLHMLLRIALEPLLNHTASSHHFPSLPRSPQSLADAISPEVLVGVSTGAAASTGASRGGLEVLAGAVEFESAFSRASDAHPMCFHRLVLPGYLKVPLPALTPLSSLLSTPLPALPCDSLPHVSLIWGMEQADMFKHRLKKAFPHPGPDPFCALASPDNASVGDASAGSSSADGATVRLLYITRNASLTRGRRVMSEESSKALLNLFHQLNFQVCALSTMMWLCHFSGRPAALLVPSGTFSLLPPTSSHTASSHTSVPQFLPFPIMLFPYFSMGPASPISNYRQHIGLPHIPILARFPSTPSKSHNPLFLLPCVLAHQVVQVEFTPLTFVHQLALVQAADIIVSLHGAGLTNPASCARPSPLLSRSTR
ncbi:unnamed protein product [Closterium sp. Naga37s-1]|nr:unnamed protein product [Closterium sp. Naga37s-1]